MNSNFRSIVAKGRAGKSARGLAHSKTWRISTWPTPREGVLECASPLALFARAIGFIGFIRDSFSRNLFLCTILSAAVAHAAEPPPAPPVDAARAIIQRLLPKQHKHFAVEIIDSAAGQDVFEIESRDGKIILRGNNGVAIASALNRYLSQFCHCDISWNCGNQLNLPKHLPAVSAKIRVASPHKFHYAYNYCTHGYTMAWWDWPRWEEEIDFLALSGVNLALVIEGQESVWIDTFRQLGYADAELRQWLVLPTHQPWMYMSNMEGYGGPLTPVLVEQRLELGQKIVNRMRELGIEPVLQGYYGIVPPGFNKKWPDAKIDPQGNWGKLRRPDMLEPTDSLFGRVASEFYFRQKKLFGPVNFYAADPFHEGGNLEGIDLAACGRAIYQPMNGATWVIQSWQANPRQAMIDTLDKSKLLVLDLWCEAQEHWRTRTNFNGTPWLWCTIENFGGNVGLSGRLAWIAREPVHAMQDPVKGRMSGIGATMEGSGTCPMLWEMFFENSWRSTTPEVGSWLADYSFRRYGTQNASAEQAVEILADTVYKAPASRLELPINSVVCARPSLDPDQRARGWGSTRLYYDPSRLFEAWKLLLDAAPQAKTSAGYRYDLADIGRQVLANTAQIYHQQIIAAFQAKDTNSLRALSDKTLGLIRDMDELTGTQPEFLLGAWLEDARRWGANREERDRYEQDARELLTTWTSDDAIPDYANRQWNGLLVGFYYHRWQMWLQALNDSLAKGVSLNESTEREKIRDWELSWTRQHDRYPSSANGDVVAISTKLLAKYAVDASRSIPPEKEQGK